jgi:hypothetical protein
MKVHGKRKEAGTVQEDWGRKRMAAAPTTSGAQGQDVEGEVHGKERAAATMDRRRAGGRWRGEVGHVQLGRQRQTRRGARKGHGGGLGQGAGLGRRLGERGKKGGCTAGWNFKNCGAGTVKQGSREDYPEEEEGRLGTTGPKCNFSKFQGPVCKPAITFKLGLKRKSVQNESCKTFQALQLCFRV